jgi:hypothetical protein
VVDDNGFRKSKVQPAIFMTEIWRINYWIPYWNHPVELIIYSFIVFGCMVVMPIGIIIYGLTYGLFNPRFMIFIPAGSVVFIGGLMFFPYQPVRICFNNSRLSIRKRILWNGLSIDISRLKSWMFFPDNKKIMLGLSELNKENEYNRDPDGWFNVPIHGITKQDLDFFINFLKQQTIVGKIINEK